MSDPGPPEKPSIKREGFLIKDGAITCNGHERVETSRLEKLLHPERAGGTYRTQKKYADEAKKLFSRAFFAGQLRFYGIAFARNANEAQLRLLLEQALVTQQVRAPVLFTPCVSPRTDPDSLAPHHDHSVIKFPPVSSSSNGS